MRCVLVRTSVGHVLRDLETGQVVCGPTWSYGALSQFTKENKLTIVERITEDAVTYESGPTPAKGEAAKREA